MERRFSCTACGKCCHGLLPLTIDDALAHADRFPLVIVWTPVRQGGRSYNITAELGITIRLKNRKNAAVRIAPTAYIPPSFPCPELTDEGLCGIHTDKPQRCRTMPFSAYRDEGDQDDLMIPRTGTLCDTSAESPVVYRDKSIVTREDFATEREQLIRDAAILQPYAEWLLDCVPSLKMDLHKVAMKPAGGQLIAAFSTLIPRLPKVNIYDLADKQLPIMKTYADRTKGDSALAEFHRRYTETATEWETVVNSRS
jgi:Fe-S-cluster containining protein